jgi:type VI secretion system VasD/TssJ family lipoprotein
MENRKMSFSIVTLALDKQERGAMVLSALRTIDRWAWIVLLAIFILSSCTTKPDPVPSWGFGSKALQITYTADKLLNSYENKPHTLLLVVYQLDNVNAFNKFTAYKEGLEKLLEAQNFDPSVMGIKKVFVEPKTKKNIVLNRAENAKWVGIVAGYYDLAPGKVNKSFEIPFKVVTRGFIRNKKTAQIQPLHLNLLFGPHSIQEIGKQEIQDKP